MGDPLEIFVKDLFCGSLDIDNYEEKEEIHRQYLSYLGSQNHPPDFMIRGGEAFEVKRKRKGTGESKIALNSSYPMQKMSNDYSRLNNDGRTCEDDIGGWDEKDMVYVTGLVKGKDVEFIWIVYGDCFAAPRDIYKSLAEKVSSKIDEGVQSLKYGYLQGDGNEIGGVKEVDPRGRSKLRIRGMWDIEHPAKSIKEHIEDFEDKKEEHKPLYLVLREEKYSNLPNEDKDVVESEENINIYNVNLPDPADENKKIGCKIIETGVEK